MTMTLGVDVAVKAAHQASLAVDGTLVWTGRKFFSRPADLEKLWAALALSDPSVLTVVVEPTRNAWIVLACWFRARGAKVVMVPTTQSADLRDYYSKHAKNDRLDSAMLARLPLLHPEGLREFTGAGPADPLRRLVKQRSSIVKRRTGVLQRIDSLLDLLGPAWHDVLGGHYGKAALMLLSRYGDPNALLRLGHARLSRFLIRHSRGAWREGHAERLLAAARETLQLWSAGGLDFAELAADIAVEAEQAQVLTEQVEDLDERIANLYADADPDGLVASAPGVGPVLSAIIAGRIGNPHRFTSLAAVRSYSGLVPKLNQSGTSNPVLGITKAGDPLLREALFVAADQARRVDPQLAAKYQHLMNQGRHHCSALCTIATILLTRIATCWRHGQPYVLRDTDNSVITEDEGRAIVRERHALDRQARITPATARQAQHRKGRTSREQKESQSAPASRPVKTEPTSLEMA